MQKLDLLEVNVEFWIIWEKTSLKWLTVAMPFLKIRERLERDKRVMELWLMA